MRPLGTSEQLAARRERALALLDAGQSPAQVAAAVGATAQSVRRWKRESQRPTREAKRRRLGRPSRLSAAQLRALEQALKRGAYTYGYAEDYWTLDRMAHLIWDLFGLRYQPSGVWYVLQRLGWSCQRPARRTFARDEQAVEHWKRYDWPRIKKVAAVGRDADFHR